VHGAAIDRPLLVSKNGESAVQEDPIGIAGGLNLYGYANGDPVNFGDPFGLCTRCSGGDRERYPDPFYAIGEAIVRKAEELEQLRVSLNMDLPGSANEALAEGFIRLPFFQSILHENGDEYPEEKYINFDGREVVFDGRDGAVVTDPEIAGSYNFVVPLPANYLLAMPEVTLGTWLGHFMLDMVPPMIAGGPGGG